MVTFESKSKYKCSKRFCNDDLCVVLSTIDGVQRVQKKQSYQIGNYNLTWL